MGEQCWVRNGNLNNLASDYSPAAHAIKWFQVFVSQRTAKRWTKFWDTRTELLFFPLNLLFCQVVVVVADVVYSGSVLSCGRRMCYLLASLISWLIVQTIPPKKCSLCSLTAQLPFKLNYQCERCFSRKIMQSSYLFQVFNEDFEYPLNDKGNLDFHFVRPSELVQSAYHVKLRHQKRTKIQIQMFSNIHKA